MNVQQPHRTRTVGLLAGVALTLGLVACGERVDTASSAPTTAPATTAPAPQATTTPAPADTTVGQRVDNAMERTERRIDDAAITASVNASLAKDPDLSAMKIDVDTKSGVVTLTGPAPTPAAKERATSLAQSVEGVAGVNNNLEVRAS